MKRIITRKSNVELLRIILMLMVIGVHYNLVGMGSAFYYTQSTGINISLSYLLESICIVCVDTFIIITGYFLINKKEININKVPKFIIMILFFNLIQYILNIIINKVEIDKTSFFTQLFAGKWFIIIYLALYLLSPYINKLLNKLTTKEYKKLIILLVSIFIIYQTFLSYIRILIPVVGWSGIIDSGIDKGYTIINFIILYAIGGYIRKTNYKPSLKKSIIIYLVSTLLIFLSWYILGHSKYSEYASNSFYYNNIFVVISSIYIFMIFNRISIKSKIINYISKYNIAIFILSTSPLLINLYNILKVEKYSISNYFVPHFIFTCIVIYITSLIISIIGNFVLDKTVFKVIDRGGYEKCYLKKEKK